MRALLCWALLLGLWLAPVSASAQMGGLFGGAVEVPNQVGDAAAAAGLITVTGVVEGDALLAGGEVQVLGEITGDVRGLSGKYRQTGSVFGEVSIAAGSILLEGLIGDDLWAAGEDIELREDTRIGQDARIAGEDVLARGRIDGDLDIVAEQVALDAQVGGDVTIDARRIVVGPGATIEGQLRWRAMEEPVISPEAIIRGGVEGEQVGSRPFRWRGFDASNGVFANAWLARLAIAMSAFGLGLTVLLIAPNWYKAAVESVRGQWLWAGPAGAACLFIAAVGIVLLAVSTLGLPLALLLAMAAPLLLLFGYALAAAALGGTLVDLAPRRSPRWAGLAAGVAALAILGLFPWVGALVGPVACIIGVGGAAMSQLRIARA